MSAPVGASLAAALAAFQGEMPSVRKGKTATVPTKTGGSYRYSYADLADVTAAAAPLLSKHGLAFVAQPQPTERGWELVGLLVHKSGETVSGTLPLHGGTEQAMGSSLTYGRRYLLGCLTGLVTDDDEDGQIATTEDRPPPRKTRTEALLADIAALAGKAHVPLQTVADDWARAHDGASIRDTTDIGGLELLRADLAAQAENYPEEETA